MSDRKISNTLTSRERILQFLLFHSGSEDQISCTVKNIAKELNLTSNAVRQHLTVLEGEDLIEYAEHKGKTGRPALIYSLKKNALNVFPKIYAEFSLRLLEEITLEYGMEAAKSILVNIGKKNALAVKETIEANLGKRMLEIPLKQRLKSLVSILKEYGKFAELSEDTDSFLVKNFNCLVYDVTRLNTLVCNVDETMMNELTDFRANKEKCIKEGDGYCLYRIKKT